MNQHTAVRADNGQWQVVRIVPAARSVIWRGRPKKVSARQVIESGLSMGQAIARAAELNGSREMREKSTVRPRHRVGVRAA